MKNKVLLTIIFVLLISNILLLYFFFNKNNGKDRGREKMMEKFKKEIGLSDTQAKKFEALRKEQRESIKPMFDSVNIIRNEYINAMYKGLGEDSLKILFTDKMSKQMLTIDKKMYDQFMEARKICTPNQYQAYDSIIKKILTRTPDRGPQNKKHN